MFRFDDAGVAKNVRKPLTNISNVVDSSNNQVKVYMLQYFFDIFTLIFRTFDIIYNILYYINFILKLIRACKDCLSSFC